MIEDLYILVEVLQRVALNKAEFKGVQSAVKSIEDALLDYTQIKENGKE